jgi:hypothetical protein
VWAWIILAVAAVGAVVAVAASSSDDDSNEASATTVEVEATEPVVEETAPEISVTPEATVESVPATEPAETEAPTTEETTPSEDSGSIEGAPPGVQGSHADPVPAGQVADMGQGWRLQILNLTPDGTAAVAAENEFNSPPPAGSAFTLVEVALGYFGRDDPATPFLTTISAVGAANTELSADCGVIPQQLDVFSDLFAGGLVTGNLCFVTTPEDQAALQLYTEVGFGEDQVFLNASTAPSGVTPMAGLPGPQPGAAATPARLSPISIGTATDVGEGWQATVTGPASDITDTVLSENPFNEPPPEGRRFIGVPVKYSYNGTESSSSALSVTIKAVGSSNQQLASDCGVVPGEVDFFSDIFAGGTVEGLICFVVPTDVIPSVILYGTAGFEGNYQYFATS